MLCFSVDSPDSLENVESKWVGEIAENCPGVKLVLVALKCDLREQEKDDREDGREPKRRRSAPSPLDLNVALAMKPERNVDVIDDGDVLLVVSGLKGDDKP